MSKRNQDIKLIELEGIVQATSPITVVRRLLDKGLINVYEGFKSNYKPKREDYVCLHSELKGRDEAIKETLDNLEKAPKQLDLLLMFLHEQHHNTMVSKKELIKKANSSMAVLHALIEKKILSIKTIDVSRVDFELEETIQENILSVEQEEAYKQVRQYYESHKPILLHGITGSGKTHVYFELIKDCISNGKTALYLLPEIALTAQMVRRLYQVFGKHVGVYHSRFSDMERVELWHKVLNREYDIVIGARSSLLLPFSNLGLIIVDEEHDTSYKQQEGSPRYHARDTAIYLANQYKVPIILGSATPSLETFYNVQNGKYLKVEMLNRYGKAKLPTIQLVNMKEEKIAKNATLIFSEHLLSAIKESIEKGKQVILFQNRRGYAPVVICRTCGWIPQCKHCDVSLTYHKVSDSMHCHYCSSKSPFIKFCAACGLPTMTTKSFGTEKVEEEIKKYFPNARVQRFDWDVLRTKNKHNEIIKLFEKRQIDILIGTQMVVKGLDFEHVNLVGVLSADGLLSYPDFRVHERAFQLIQQVSGRSGRSDDQGKVLIQTYKPEHPLFNYLLKNDYEGFCKKELESRKEFLYPPYTRLIKVTVKHKKKEIAEQAAQMIFDACTKLDKSILIGPAEPPVGRVRTYYIQELLLKLNPDTNHVQLAKAHLKNTLADISTKKNFSTLISSIDVDPM